VPFTAWAMSALILHGAAREFVTFGLVVSALLAITKWAGVVLRSKEVGDDSDGPSWKPEGRAMVYVGRPNEKS
jgi:hypothetical protein